MATDSDVRDQAYNFFIEEAPELLQSMEEGILTLRNDKDKAVIHNIMRAAHSLKGGAASVGLETIKDIAHRLEDIFKALFSETVTVDRSLETLLLKAYDRLRYPLMDQIERGSFDEEYSLRRALEVIEKLEYQLQHAMTEMEDYVPTSEDIGVDVVSSIFEVDVAQEIDRLKAAMANPKEQQLAGELRACAEVFSGFGEMLNLPGFSHLAQTIHEVLDQHPDQALAITRIAVADFTKARESVLAGDRTSGGEPSPELLQWLATASSPTPSSSELTFPLGEEETFDFGDDLNIASMDLAGESSELLDWGLEDGEQPIEEALPNAPTANELALEALGFDNGLDLPPELGDMDLFWEAEADEAEEELLDEAQEPDSSFSFIDSNDQAYRFFIEEVPELLHNIEQGLLRIREERTTNLVHEIMRSAHSIKGGAASVWLDPIRDIAHRLEDIFKALFNEEVAIDGELETWMLEGFDCLREPLEQQMHQGHFDGPQALAKALTVIEKIEHRLGSALTDADDYIPSSEDLGIDIVSSIFDVDVAESLEKIQQLIEDRPDSFEDELLAQMEVFGGFAELLNLPGFGEITATVIQAIEKNPDQLDAIAQVTLENLTAAHGQVMAGDRDRGGEPSAALLAFIETPELGQQTPTDLFGTLGESSAAIVATTMMEEGADLFGDGDFSDEDEFTLEGFAPPATMLEPSNNFPGEMDLMDFNLENAGLSTPLEQDEIEIGMEDLDLFSDFGEATLQTSAPGENTLDDFDLGAESFLPEDTTFGPSTLDLDDPINFEDDFDLSALDSELESHDPSPMGEQDPGDLIPGSLNFALADDQFDDNIFGETDLAELSWDEEPSPALALEEEEFPAPPSDSTVTPAPESGAVPPNGRTVDIIDDVRTDEAYQFFIEEVPELLHTMEEGLLKLRHERTTGLVHEIMRAAHSIKGGAASVGLNSIKEIAHRLEDIFKALFNENIEIDRRLDRLLLDGYDRLKHPLMEQLRRGQFDGARAYQDALKVIQEIEAILGDDLYAADDYLPSSEDLGVDIVSSIFEVDVAEGLEQIEAMAQNPGDYDLATALTNQMEVFSGLAEILNLPGFGEIVTTVNQAIAAHPEQLPLIANLAFQDFTTASQLVLDQGDRDSGGSPSPALMALASEQGETRVSPEAVEVETFPLVPEVEMELTLEPSPEPIDFLEQSDQELSIDFDIITGANDNATDQELFSLNAPETEEPALEDIFATMAEDMFGSAAPEISLEQTFESLVSEETLPELEEAFGTIPLEEDGPTIDNLTVANLFGETADPTITPRAMEDQELLAQAVEMAQGIPDFSLPENQPPDLQLRAPQLPNLEDIPSGEDDRPITDLFAEAFGEDSSAPIAKDPSSTMPRFPDTTLEDVLTTAFGPTTPLSLEPPTVEPAELTTPAPADPLEQNILKIKEAFDNLPSDGDSKFVLRDNQGQKQRQAVDKTTKIKATPKQRKKVQPSTLSIRVPIDRLEKMNDVVGELAINRNSLALQNDQLQTKVKELLNRFLNFQEIASKLQDISDQLIINPDRIGGGNGNGAGTADGIKTLPKNNGSQDSYEGLDTQFDSLEMDSYNVLSTQMQSVLEELMLLEESVDDVALFARQSDATIESQKQMLDRLRDELMWSRMLPLGDILKRFPRVLRDLSNRYDKPAELKLSGTGVLVDKAVLEKLYDPLLHLLRNAFDHGLEDATARGAAGKPEKGTIEIRAYHQGSQTLIEIKDDGQGINYDRLAQKVVERGLLREEQLNSITPEELVNFIFEPGFSTAAKVSDLSGRGVGLDVVRSQLETLKGSVSVSSIAHKGTTFTMRLPLTLSITKILVFAIGMTALGIASDGIEEIMIPRPDRVKVSAGQRFLNWREQIVPIHSVKNLLHYNCSLPESSNIEQMSAVATPAGWALPVLILKREDQVFALEVERLITEQELVIKPFDPAIAPPNYMYGCTILGDGTLIPVIEGISLLEETLGANFEPKVKLNSSLDPGEVTPTPAIPKPAQISTVLVVDDSAALRKTLAFTLQKAGYRVVQAKDGKEALEKLHQTAHVEMVICDVEMPNMNGFEFLGQKRKDKAIKTIPVAMLTSRSNDKHRRLATQLGATAYFSKPYVEQQFLGSIQEIIAKHAPKAKKVMR